MTKGGMIVFLALAAVATGGMADQDNGAISTAQFKGSDSWPVYAPGDLKLDNEKMHNLRIVYGATFAAPTGSTNRKVTFDIRDVFAEGRRADWLQWSFTGEKEGEEGYPNLDLLVIDAKTGQLRYRMFPAGPTIKSGGTYSFIRVSPDEVTELTVMSDGKTYPETHALDDKPVFDFGALGFVLPFLDMNDGEGIRLRTYNYSSVGPVAVYPHAYKDIRLPSGRTARIREVDVLVGGGTQMITYRIGPEAPWFYGWDYRQIDNGTSLFKMDYRDFVATDIKGETAILRSGQGIVPQSTKTGIHEKEANR